MTLTRFPILTPITDGPSSPKVVVIGAGPAGLTAAYQLVKADVTDVVVVEADDIVGGISRTVERDGWRFDIGGHRFFTKVPEVEKLWFELLAEELMVRPRMSRIFYDGKFFDYPLRAANALGNLGVIEAARCVVSYAAAKVRPPKETTNFETWVASRFGWRLYRTFFKTYTEKLWGVDATEIQADWAAQRIKNLSLGKAVWNSLMPKRGSTDVTSLIEEFLYPRLGPGMMWETCRDRVVEGGAAVEMRSPVTRIERSEGRAAAVWTTGSWATGSDGRHEYDGRDLSEVRHECDEVISSMPLGDLVLAMDPPAPDEVQAAARALKHRDFLTVALVVPEELAFPDNWIYVHSPEVKLGRVQNFGAWSPHMVKPGRTCLGLEYFVNVGDEHWSMSDEELVKLGQAEAEKIGIIPPGVVEAGYVVRMPGAYPIYDAAYAHNVDVLRAWLEANTPNVQPVGRNGMHRYNNQDHSMLTAMLAVENILDGAGHDLWSVNVEEEYHEEIDSERTSEQRRDNAVAASRGTGRAAPIIG